MEKEDMQEAILELIPETWTTVRIYHRWGYPNFDDEDLVGIMSREEAAAELAGEDDDVPIWPDAEEEEGVTVDGIPTEGICVFWSNLYYPGDAKTLGYVFPADLPRSTRPIQLLLFPEPARA